MGNPVVLLVDTRLAEEERASVVMVERLWSRLPEELVERILMWLPLPSLFRCRAVCKKWNTLMFSKDFHSTQHGGSSQTPLLLLFGQETGSSSSKKDHSYDALRSRWHKLPRSFLPYADVRPLAAAGGLILCARSILHQQLDYSCLCVCNPLTKSWRDLPVTSRFTAPMLVSMIYDRHATSFKVLVAGGGTTACCSRTGSSLDQQVGGDPESQDASSNCCWRTHLYDSATDSWRDGCEVPRGSSLRPTSVVLDGALYALRRTGEILRYDLGKGVWRDFKAPPLPTPPGCDVACLTKACGKLHLAGYARDRGAHTLRVWRLDSQANRWHQVAGLPDALHAKLLTLSQQDAVRLVAQGNWLFFMSGGGVGGRPPQTLKYDFVARVWHQIDECPFAIRVGDVLIPYEPRLDVLW